MAKIDQTKRRQVITVAIILSVALVGLMLVTTQRSSEHQSLYAGFGSTTTTPGDSAMAAATPAFDGAIGRSVATISIFKMLLALAVVIACIYGGIFMLKKMTGRKRANGNGNSLLEVLETTHLDPKKSLSLVRVAGKAVLIGVTETQINVLTEFDQEHTNTLLASNAGRPESESFGTILRSASVTLKGFGLRTHVAVSAANYYGCTDFAANRGS